MTDPVLIRMPRQMMQALTLVALIGAGLVACAATEAVSQPKRAGYAKTLPLTQKTAAPEAAPATAGAAAPVIAPAVALGEAPVAGSSESPADSIFAGKRAAAPITVQVDGIPQDFAFDPAGGYVYVQSLRKSAGHETGFVSRLRLDGVNATIVDSNLPSESVGHQGVSVERAPDGKVWLWVSRYGDHGRDAVRFPYQAGTQPQNVQTFTFFDAAYMQKNVTMPKVCADGRHLLVRGRTSPRKQFVRVFDLAALNAGGPGDYTAKARYHWALPAEVLASGLPLQGLACDSRYVYAVVGNARLNEPKTFIKLTLDGKPVQRVDDFSVSKEIASREGKQFEPEGISVLPARSGKGGSVHVGVLSGNSRDLKFRLWLFDHVR